MISCISHSAFADIYTYHDADGQLYFTDTPKGGSYKLLSVFRSHLTKKSQASYSLETYQKNKQKYLPDIQYAAEKFQISAPLLHAIIDIESAFNPHAESQSGAVGLMQLMPKTAQSLGVVNRKDAWQNIQGGARYFRQLLDRFNQDIELSLAAYNAGPTAVEKAGNHIPNYPETQRYVKKVMTKYLSLL